MIQRWCLFSIHPSPLACKNPVFLTNPNLPCLKCLYVYIYYHACAHSWLVYSVAQTMNFRCFCCWTPHFAKLLRSFLVPDIAQQDQVNQAPKPKDDKTSTRKRHVQHDHEVRPLLKDIKASKKCRLSEHQLKPMHQEHGRVGTDNDQLPKPGSKTTATRQHVGDGTIAAAQHIKIANHPVPA